MPPAGGKRSRDSDAGSLAWDIQKDFFGLNEGHAEMLAKHEISPEGLMPGATAAMVRRILGMLLLCEFAGCCRYPTGLGVDETVASVEKKSWNHVWGNPTAYSNSTGPGGLLAGTGGTQCNPINKTAIFMFRSALTNVIKREEYASDKFGVLNAPICGYLWKYDAQAAKYAWPTALPTTGQPPTITPWDGTDTFHVPVQAAVTTNGLQSTGMIPTVQQGFVNGNWNPHDNVLFSRYSAASKQDKYMWINGAGLQAPENNSNDVPSKVVIWNTVATDAKTQLTYQLFQYQGPGDDLPGPSGVLPLSSPLYTPISLQVPNSGYYRMEIGLENAPGQNLQGSYPGQWVIEQVDYTPWVWGHHAVKEVSKLLQTANDMAYPARTTLMVKPLVFLWLHPARGGFTETSVADNCCSFLQTEGASPLNACGFLFVAELEAHVDWYQAMVLNLTDADGAATDLMGNIRDYPGAYQLPAVRGTHCYLPMRRLEDVTNKGEVWTGSGLQGLGVTNCGSRLDDTSNYLVIGGETPPAAQGTQQGYFAVTTYTAVQSTTSLNTHGRGMPTTTKHAWEVGAKAQMAFPIATHNDDHMPKVLSFLKNFAHGAGRVVAAVGTIFLSAAAGAAGSALGSALVLG